jgi:hypothetical protein
VEKHPTDTPRKPRNHVLLAGIWITIVTASVWAGGYLINKIASYLPYCLGLGIIVLGVGFYLEMRKNRLLKNQAPE